MVQMRLYSIGSHSALPFRKAIIDSTSHSASVESQRALSGIEDIVRDNKYRGQKNRQTKITTYLYDTDSQLAGNFYEYIKGNVGATVPIVAYVVDNGMYTAIQRSCGCGIAKECCVSYLVALGTITKVPNLKQKDYNTAPELTFSIELTTHWLGIDHMNWRRINSSEVNAQIPIDPTTNFNYRLPSCSELFNHGSECPFIIYPQQYNSYDFMFEPTYMTKSISGSNCGSCGGSCCSGEHGHVSTYLKPTQTEFAGLNANFFNIPPKPLIVYAGITGTEDIVFRATSSKSGITRMSYESKVLLTRTNTLLVNNGHTILDENDKIVVGDFVYNENGILLRNGLIIKDGAILTDVQPVISSDGAFFGYVEPANDLKYFSHGSFYYSHTKLLFRRA